MNVNEHVREKILFNITLKRSQNSRFLAKTYTCKNIKKKHSSQNSICTQFDHGLRPANNIYLNALKEHLTCCQT